MKNILLYEKVAPLEKNFTVKFMKFDRYENLTPHWHEHIEILYFYAGNCRISCNKTSFDASGGDIVIVNSTEIHSFVVENSVGYICLLIYPEFFSDINFSNIHIKNHIKCDNHITACMDGIIQEYDEKSQGYDMMIKSYTYSLMTHLVRNYVDAYISERELSLHSANLARLNTVFKYIADNYSEKISTSALSKLCYLNESYFCRFFKTSTGKTPIEYINEYRTEKAALLLKNTDDSIARIAASTGFDDMNYFTRIFKKIKKQTPTQYKKTMLTANKE